MQEKIIKQRTINYGAGKFVEVKISEVGNSQILFLSKGVYAGASMEKRYFKGFGIPAELVREIIKCLNEVEK